MLIAPVPSGSITQWLQQLRELLVGPALLSYQRVVPVTGFTLQAGKGLQVLLLAPAGTLATGTVLLPMAPTDGQVFQLTSSQTVTALTVTPASGQTLATPPTTLVASPTAPNGYSFLYTASGKVWYRLQ